MYYDQSLATSNLRDSFEHAPAYGIRVFNPGNNSVQSFGATTLSVAAAAPITGTWKTGDIVFDQSPVAGGFVGFVCVTAGTPGTWKSLGPSA